MKYFAYGSNMSQERLKDRIGVVKKLSSYFILEGYELKFNKKSIDGSAKCNICKSNNDKVYGVLYEIPCSKIHKLDICEGYPKNYIKHAISIKDKNDITHEATTYIAKKDFVKENLNPYCWYKTHVLHGATVAGLPQDYINKYIMPAEAKPDPNDENSKKELAIYIN